MCSTKFHDVLIPQVKKICTHPRCKDLIFHLPFAKKKKKSSYESKSPRPKLDSKLSFQIQHSNNIPCTNKTQFAHEQISFHVKPKDIPINQSFNRF